MSGITGLVQFNGEPTRPDSITRMVAALRRRGPDRQTVLCEANASFAQALLATTPEALAERQPWVHSGSMCVVVCDSRLDNRPSLLRELGISRPADVVGDGELLHAAWQRWGTACADQLRGDFAFVIWDPRQQMLYGARDPMGVRPLVFHFVPSQRFVFGSSVEAVLAQGDVPTEFDEGRIADALFDETEGIDLTSTFYRAVQRLPPASWLQIKGGGNIEMQRYWLPVGDRPDGLPRSTEEWIEAQREQLGRAVRRRLRSHRPVGSMLSGGLDSSSVVALASAACASEGRPPFAAFSATNLLDPDCVETRSIQAVLFQRHCKGTLVDLASMANPQLPDWWSGRGEPFDGRITLAAQLYRAASEQGVVSLMDGVPADNLFVTGRYAQRLFDQGRLQQAWQFALAQWARPGGSEPIWPALRVMAGCFAPQPIHALRARRTDAADYRAFLKGSLASEALTRRVDMRERYRRYRESVRNSHQWHATDEALSSMAAPYITAGLERFNRVASHFGIEPRPPFTDRDLISFQAWVPIELRTRDGHAKWILRQAMSTMLPGEVAWRTDKSHVGWAFNQAHLARQLATNEYFGSLQVQASAWLDLARLKAASQDPDHTSSRGLAAALRLLAWHRHQTHLVSGDHNAS